MPLRSPRYVAMQSELARGWNTWNTNSVLSHVLLPEGLAINLCLKSMERGGALLRDAYLSSAALNRPEKVRLGMRTMDGTYTELNLAWQANVLEVQSATDGDDLVLLVTVRKNFARLPAHLIVETGMLWNRPGNITRTNSGIVADVGGRQIAVGITAPAVEDPYVTANCPYLATTLEGVIGIYTGAPRTLANVQAVIDRKKQKLENEIRKHDADTELFRAMSGVLAWNTIYDPANKRVITPVSRLWSNDWGGYVLFEWDTYFGAYMLADLDKDLAYANAVEITRSVTPNGFVPNFAAAYGQNSNDRSEPPVGSLVVNTLYRRFGERWFLDEVYDELLRWNRWWSQHRDRGGFLCWGSDTVEGLFTDGCVNCWQAAVFESGLDNSPMYDGVPFDPHTHLLALADVGLMSLYVTDCNELAEIASVLGRMNDFAELKERAGRYGGNLRSLWNEEAGLFLNRRTDTGEWSHRISPTHFYPLLAGVPTPQQAERMIRDHYFNPAEFHGEYVIPSIARNDPAFTDQAYWRGRIWGPMNFLVYLGMKNYALGEARADLAERSSALMMKSWLEKGTIHENYNALTGCGDDRTNSDGFYHWGALLGFLKWTERHVEGTATPHRPYTRRPDARPRSPR